MARLRTYLTGLTMLAATLVSGLTACSPSGPGPVRGGDGKRAAAPDISPGDFVLLPCNAAIDRPCAFVMAGGKRLMFGAPAGISSVLAPEDVAGLDALMLFSMHPEDVAGADEIRYRGWRAGRGEALQVTGPEGTGSFVEGLNLAYEQPDAISFVEDGAPAGGFVAALLSHASDVRDKALIYDSGDLKVRAVAGQGSGLSYRIGYRDMNEAWHEVRLVPCASEPEFQSGSYPGNLETTITIGCEGNVGNDAAWPLDAPLFAVKSEG